VNPCPEFDLAISLRSAGALEPDEARRLEAHLATCAACRAEAARADEVALLAKLPPVDDLERRAVRDLSTRTVEALHASERRAGLGKRVVAGVLAAAAAAVVVLAPAVLHKGPAAPAPSAVEAANGAEATWESPDLDVLWEDAQVVDFDSTSAESASDGTSAAVAAIDF
jgi:anti-sigma factor RsiW